MATVNETQQAIIDQMGGNKFRVMVGCKQMVLHSENAVRFQIGGGAKKRIKYVLVTLDRASDTYTMTFAKIYKHEWKVISEKWGVYFDQLQGTFTQETGFNTSL